MVRSREFRRGRPEDQPTEGALDELMEDPPAVSARGSLAAYAEGSRVRRRVYLGLIVGTLGAAVAARWYASHLDYQRRNPVPSYTLAEGAADEIRPNKIEWSSGFARLGLSRQSPGVEQIVLPDHLITLADGCDHAQVKVNVVDGRTVELKVLVGDVDVAKR